MEPIMLGNTVLCSFIGELFVIPYKSYLFCHLSISLDLTNDKCFGGYILL